MFPKEINGNKEYIVLLTGFVEKDFFTFKTNSKYMSKVMDHDSKEKIKNEVDSSIKDDETRFDCFIRSHTPKEGISL